MKYVFNTNAVLTVRDNKNIEKDVESYDFVFLDNKISWYKKINSSYVILNLTIPGVNNNQYLKSWEIINKFASLIIYRETGINKFEYVAHVDGNCTPDEIQCNQSFDTFLIPRGDERYFNKKYWSMLSFLLEAKNASSIYYKFFCLYKIIEIENLILKNENKSKETLTAFINKELPLLLDDFEKTDLDRNISRSRLKKTEKNYYGYFDHLLRDAFAHVGYLNKNEYKYGYPTLNPLNQIDYKKYNKANDIFLRFAKQILINNEKKFLSKRK